MIDLEITGFEWDSHNLPKVLEKYPERELTKEEIESVFDDENLFLEFARYDARRFTPYYLCLGISNKGRLLKLTFELTKNHLARIFHAHPTSKNKFKELYFRKP